MEFTLDWATLGLGVLIFCARVADVSAGTVRTISIVQGRTLLAFVLGFVEISLWLAVIAAVLSRILAEPVLGVFYALGFSTGNVVGIKLERRLAFGHMVLRVVSRGRAQDLCQALRDAGQGVTTFAGQGRDGPVTLLYVACRRRDLPRLADLVEAIEPGAFFIAEPAGQVSKLMRPHLQTATGWRAMFKKK